MADQEEKTEQPTAKRKSQSRQKGVVAKSADLNSAVMLLVGTLMIWLLGRYMSNGIKSVMLESFNSIPHMTLTANNVHYYTVSFAKFMAGLLGPLFVFLFIVGILVNVLQIGWLFTMTPLKPDLAKVFGPAAFKKLFSPDKFVDLLKSLAKMGIVFAIGLHVVTRHYAEYLYLADQGIGLIILMLLKVLLELILKCAILLLILGIIDFIYQRYKTNKQMKMTKQEVKDEMKSQEGDPQIKGRLKAIRLEMHRKLMMSEVPKATVVVTNPTHIAIAIRYAPGEDNAPMVLAKGKRKIAEKIKSIAKEHNIPMVENKPLARAMVDVVHPGQPIPEAFFAPVAEVLAYVYNLKENYATTPT